MQSDSGMKLKHFFNRMGSEMGEISHHRMYGSLITDDYNLISYVLSGDDWTRPN
jgi:hypothetical protein